MSEILQSQENNMKNKIVALGSFITAFSLAGVAFAADLSTTTGNQINDDFLSAVSGMIEHYIPEILVVVAVLIGIGWGVRKFQRHASGRKF